MNFTEAQHLAQRHADKTGNSVLVYQKLNGGYLNGELLPEFGIAYTLPNFAVRVGERYYPTTSESTGFDNDCQ